MSAAAIRRLNHPISQIGFHRIVACQQRRQSMAAASGSPCLDDFITTTCSNGLDFTKLRSGGCISSVVGSMWLCKREQLIKNRLVCHYTTSIDPLMIQSRRASLFFDRFSRTRNVHTSSSSTLCSSSLGPAHDLSGSTTPSTTTATATTSSSLKSLKLVSGSCYLPHPEKESTGGEDAHFICDEEQAIGVADGVGGWAEVGVDAGLFSRELMSYSVSAIREHPKSSSVDPLMVLEKAHSQTTAKGSSTAVIIALTDKGLHAINLGDSGFTVVRDGTTVFQSPVQQHGFNFTYQLESGNSGNNGDMPNSGQVFMIDVQSGDVIVAGTDGVYDNLYNEDIISVVVSSVRAGLDPKATAKKIAELARERAVDRKRQSPFAAAAQEAGFRYFGGKLDDITAVVSYVTPSQVSAT
ncbi:unnamed protein product [Cochlearia groenlandica]